MTKKNDPFEGAEIDQDSEPLHFEETSSLFDEESASENPSPIASEPEQVPTQEASSEEVVVEEDQEPLENNDEVYTIGAFLKQMREEKGINLKIISQHTKISVTNLENLEADDLEKLPNRAYVKGYVKSYAKALQLNQEDCLELLDVTYGIEKEAPLEKNSTHTKTAPLSSEVESNSDTDESESNGIKIGIAIGALAVISFLLILNNTGDKEEEPVKEVVKKVAPAPPKKVVPQTLGATTPLKDTSKEEVLEVELQTTKVEPAKPAVLATPIPQKQLEEIKKVEAPKEVKKEEKKEVVKVEEKKEVKKKEEKKEEKKEVVKKKKEEKISFRALSKVLYSDDSSVKQAEIDRLLPNKYRAAVVPGQHNVFINAYKADSWLTYKSDDGPIKKFVLKKGRTILIRGKLIRVFLGNLGAVKVFRNNKPQRITNPSGVKSLVFPQERGSEFVIPLFIFHKNGNVQTSEDYLAEQDN